MNTMSRTIVGACAALAVLAPTATLATAAPVEPASVSAKAAAKKYTVVQKFQKAKLGVCKVNKGNRWRVFGRLDTRSVTSGKYMGTLLVFKAGTEDPTAISRSAVTKKGKVVTAGSVNVPKTGGYSLAGGVGSANAGNGGPIKISKIRVC